MARMRKHLEEARANFQPGGGAIVIGAAKIGALERFDRRRPVSGGEGKGRLHGAPQRHFFRAHGDPGVATPVLKGRLRPMGRAALGRCRG